MTDHFCVFETNKEISASHQSSKLIQLHDSRRNTLANVTCNFAWTLFLNAQFSTNYCGEHVAQWMFNLIMICVSNCWIFVVVGSSLDRIHCFVFGWYFDGTFRNIWIAARCFTQHFLMEFPCKRILDSWWQMILDDIFMKRSLNGQLSTELQLSNEFVTLEKLWSK